MHDGSRWPGRLAATLLIAFASLGARAATIDKAYEFDEGKDRRSYVVSRPDTCRQDCPLVLDLHGHGGSAEMQGRHSGLRASAERNGFVAVFADGLHSSWNGGSGPYGACCGVALKQHADDVAFLRHVVEHVAGDFPIDRARIYVTGWSNGCAMAQRLVAEASDVFAAAACTGHYLLTMQKSLPRPVSVTEIHALDDPVIEYREQDRFTGARENAARWAALDHCRPTPTHARLGGGSDVATYEDCADGVRVRLVTLARSGHDAYANGDGVDVAQLVWDSVREARLPPPQPRLSTRAASSAK